MRIIALLLCLFAVTAFAQRNPVKTFKPLPKALPVIWRGTNSQWSIMLVQSKGNDFYGTITVRNAKHPFDVNRKGSRITCYFGRGQQVDFSLSSININGWRYATLDNGERFVLYDRSRKR